jgi:hypothetical protein
MSEYLLQHLRIALSVAKVLGRCPALNNSTNVCKTSAREILSEIFLTGVDKLSPLEDLFLLK